MCVWENLPISAKFQFPSDQGSVATAESVPTGSSAVVSLIIDIASFPAEDTRLSVSARPAIIRSKVASDLADSIPEGNVMCMFPHCNALFAYFSGVSDGRQYPSSQMDWELPWCQ